MIDDTKQDSANEVDDQGTSDAAGGDQNAPGSADRPEPADDPIIIK